MHYYLWHCLLIQSSNISNIQLNCHKFPSCIMVLKATLARAFNVDSAHIDGQCPTNAKPARREQQSSEQSKASNLCVWACLHQWVISPMAQDGLLSGYVSKRCLALSKTFETCNVTNSIATPPHPFLTPSYNLSARASNHCHRGPLRAHAWSLPRPFSPANLKRNWTFKTPFTHRPWGASAVNFFHKIFFFYQRTANSKEQHPMQIIC